MRKVENASHELEALLQRSGISYSNPIASKVWGIFKSFCQLDFDCVEDRLLIQWTNYKEYNSRLKSIPNLPQETEELLDLFELDFCRQFTVLDNDEYVQLHCKLSFNSSGELEHLKSSNMWSDGFDTYTKFFNAVEEKDGFLIPIQKFSPIKLNVTQHWT